MDLGPSSTLFSAAAAHTVGWWKNAQGCRVARPAAERVQAPCSSVKRPAYSLAIVVQQCPSPLALDCGRSRSPGRLAPRRQEACPEGMRTCGEGCPKPSRVPVAFRIERPPIPAMTTRHLPPGWLGIVAASMLAAFMSSMDATFHLNWGSSHLVQDSQALQQGGGTASPLRVGRTGSGFLPARRLRGPTAMESIVGGVWLLAHHARRRHGSVWLGRWIWWRVSARVELVAMGSATTLAGVTLLVQAPTVLGLENPVFVGDIPKSSEMLFVIVGTLILWIGAALISPPSPVRSFTLLPVCTHRVGVGDPSQRGRSLAQTRPPGAGSCFESVWASSPSMERFGAWHPG